MSPQKDQFQVPFVANIPVELEQELNKRVSTDVAYVKLKEEKISKTYNRKKIITTLRKVGDFLLNNFSKEVSYKQIADKLKTSEMVIRQCVSDLNFWSEYPLQMIPIPKKAGFIKSCLKDPEDTAKFLKKKARTIATMEQVYTNTEVRARIKEKPQRKKEAIEVKVKSKNKKEKSE